MTPKGMTPKDMTPKDMTPKDMFGKINGINSSSKEIGKRWALLDREQSDVYYDFLKHCRGLRTTDIMDIMDEFKRWLLSFGIEFRDDVAQKYAEYKKPVDKKNNKVPGKRKREHNDSAKTITRADRGRVDYGGIDLDPKGGATFCGNDRDPENINKFLQSRRKMAPGNIQDVASRGLKPDSLLS